MTRTSLSIPTSFILAALSLVLLGLPAAATASDDASADADTDRGFPPRSRCFPGTPGSDCPGFMLSEITTGKVLRQHPHLEDNYLTLELGYLRSRGERTAIGFSGSVTWSEDQRYGLHAHYRRWLSPSFSLDLSPGVWASGRSMFDNQFDHIGFSARADLMWEETFGIGVEMDSGKPFRQESGTQWKTGLRAGGYASIVAAGALAFFAIVYAIAVSDPNY